MKHFANVDKNYDHEVSNTHNLQDAPLVLALNNNTIEPANSRHAGANAPSASRSVKFISHLRVTTRTQYGERDRLLRLLHRQPVTNDVAHLRTHTELTLDFKMHFCAKNKNRNQG